MRKMVLVGLGVAVLTGCAPRNPGWIAEDGSKGRAADDYAACRRWADDRLDPDRSAGERASGSPFAEEDRAMLRRQLNAMVAGCMQDRGYRPAPRK
jgi:hypothetical protein